MNSSTPKFGPWEIGALLRGEAGPVAGWMARWELPRLALHLGVIILGAGLYGAAMGAWRAPEQALYTAIKLPMILLLTTLGNALLNAMLAPLLGLNLAFRQSLLAILMSSTIAAMILGSFSPIVAFVVWNAPALPPAEQMASGAYAFVKLLHVAMIAFAGVIANVKLRRILVEIGGNPAAATRVLLAWLAGNLLLGGELSWILRPFIGSPLLPVAFLRDDALQSNFFEAVWLAL
jgi:hypothetical protein